MNILCICILWESFTLWRMIWDVFCLNIRGWIHSTMKLKPSGSLLELPVSIKTTIKFLISGLSPSPYPFPSRKEEEVKLVSDLLPSEFCSPCLVVKMPNWLNSPVSHCSHDFRGAGQWWVETGLEIRRDTNLLPHIFSFVFPIFLSGIIFSTAYFSPTHVRLIRRKSLCKALLVSPFSLSLSEGCYDSRNVWEMFHGLG